MPHRIVLSQSQREGFTALPIELTELAKHYTLSDVDLGMIRKRRESKNRIGFAIQLCLMRFPGRRLQSSEQLPDKLIAFVAEQIAVNPVAFYGYAEREETRREHFLLLARLLKMESFGKTHYRSMTRWLIPIAVENPESGFLVGALLNELRLKRILHPVLPVIERIVAIAKRNADQRIFKLINRQLQDQHRSALDEWLMTNEKLQSRLSWIRQPVGRPCPANVLLILERLDAIKALSFPDSILNLLPASRRELLTREGSRINAYNLRTVGDARRYSILVVYLLEHSRALVDEAIAMHDRIVGNLIKKSKRKYAEHLQKETRLIKQVISTLASLGEVLVESRESKIDVWSAIDKAFNLGLTRMAQACRGTTFKQLSWTADWYVRDDSYSRALAELVNFHRDTELVNSWGDGSTSSSDGQNFPVGNVARRLGDVNPKYGSHPGVTVYTHISDQYSPFHTRLIHTNTRDATFVLDGLLYHGSNLNIKEHYTDTAGFTDHVFGLCHLLGFKFAPRIRDIGDLVLYTPDKPDKWPQMKTILGDRMKSRAIESQWDDLLRLTSSIRLGTVTASLIIRKLASYPRQNKLAMALREFGRIERTLFLLEWMQKPDLRARVQAGLNKGEARNDLARAVFFNRLGEVRDKSFENQSYRVSGLNLVVAAIILWNTIHLEEAIAEVKKRRTVPDEYLSYLSPLGWEHISLTGDYIWKMKS